MESKIRTYEEMKDSGVEWIGRVPGHWKISKMKAFLRNSSVKNHPDALVLSLYRDYGVVPKDSRDDNHNVTSEDTASYKYVEAGDLVINKMKAWQGSLGLSRYTGIVSPAYYVCKFISKEISPEYLHHLIRSQAYAQEFERLSTGMRVGQWDLGIDDFLRVPLLLPPLSEQEAIAAYLDDKCGAIDDIITEAKAGIEEYKAWKASVIFEAVTKGLDPNAEMKDSGVEWIGQIPTGWSLQNIGKCASFFNGDRGNNYPKPDDFVQTGVPFLTSYNLEKDIVDTEHCKYISREKYHSLGGAKLELNDIVYCLRGSVGKCAINLTDTEGTVASSLMTIRARKIQSKFLLYLLLSDVALTQTEIFMNGTCAANLSAANVASYKIPVPPLSEQAAIAAYLDDKCAAIDSIIAEKEALIAELETYKKSLIFETVTGKRRVC